MCIYLSGQHSGVGRSLITIGLHLHASGNAGNGFPSGQIRHMDEGVVEAGKDVCHSENGFSFADLWSQGNLDLLLLYLVLTWRHSKEFCVQMENTRG